MKDGDKVNIGGLDVTIASMEACEQAEALICSRKAVPWTSPFDDNLEAPCSQCGERWDDDPQVVALTFTVEQRNIDR